MNFRIVSRLVNSTPYLPYDLLKWPVLPLHRGTQFLACAAILSLGRMQHVNQIYRLGSEPS
jgi:hypothetical protein